MKVEDEEKRDDEVKMKSEDEEEKEDEKKARE